MGWNYMWRPYVPVATRRAQAHREMGKLRKKGLKIEAVEVQGRKIAQTFWGKAWCDHLEKFSDYANRLPRGRTYVRNGSVRHLGIAEGAVEAIVSGSELYDVNVKIKKLPGKKWKDLKSRSARGIGSLLELLEGRLSGSVMEVVTDRDNGLFPRPREIRLDCSCPDWATMCKHVAAVLYGVGARLDEKPELLFLLRGVDPQDLIAAQPVVATGGGKGRRIAESDLSDVFGIELAGKKTRKKGGKKGGKKAAKPRPAPLTGPGVARLRTKFGMTQGQLGRLLGVSPPAIGQWEKKKGRLNVRSRSADRWKSIAALAKGEAWDMLER